MNRERVFRLPGFFRRTQDQPVPPGVEELLGRRRDLAGLPADKMREELIWRGLLPSVGGENPRQEDEWGAMSLPDTHVEPEHGRFLARMVYADDGEFHVVAQEGSEFVPGSDYDGEVDRDEEIQRRLQDGESLEDIFPPVTE